MVVYLLGMHHEAGDDPAFIAGRPWQHRPSVRNGPSGQRHWTDARRPIQGFVG